MAKVKGIQLKAVMTFLKNRYGEDAVNASIEALPQEFKHLLPAILLDSSWYPYDVWRAVRRVSAPLAAAEIDTPDLTTEMGKFMADYTLGGPYRSLLEKDPIKQVEKFSWVHDFFYQDAQKIETVVLSNSSCLVRYRYEPGVRPARSTCATTLGFWMRTVELAGGANATGAHSKCVIDAQDCCEFLLEWSDLTASKPTP